MGDWASGARAAAVRRRLAQVMSDLVSRALPTRSCGSSSLATLNGSFDAISKACSRHLRGLSLAAAA